MRATNIDANSIFLFLFLAAGGVSAVVGFLWAMGRR